jgi:biotin carboxyl carrier protein
MVKENKRIILFIIIIFFLSLLSFANVKKRHCSMKPIVKVKKAQKSSLKKYREFQGEFVFEIVHISSPVSGIVSDIKVSEGDVTSKGTVLIVIDNNLSDKIKEIEAEITKWKRILQKRKLWKERNPNAEAQAEKKIKENTDLLEKIKKDIENYSIKTPFTGKVQSIKVNIGDNVEKGAIVADIINKSNMYSTIQIDEKERKLLEGKTNIKIREKETDNIYDVVIKTITDDSVVLYLYNKNFIINKPFPFSFKIFEKEYNNSIIIPENIIKEDSKGKYLYTLKEKKGFLGIVKKMVATKTYIKEIDYYDKKYVLDKASNIQENDYLIISELDFKNEEIPISKSVCIRNGILVKILQKNIKVKAQTKKKKRPVKVKKKEKKVIKEMKVEKKIEEKKIEKKKIEEKPIKKEKEKKKIKKKEKKVIKKEEFKFLKFIKNNKTLLGYDTLHSGYITYNRLKISVLGKNLNIMKLITETLKYRYKFFQVEKKKGKIIFSSVFYKIKPPEEKIKPEFIKKEKIKIGKAKYDYAMKLSFGSYFTKAKEIDEISQFLTTKGVSPEVKSNIFLLKPSVEFIYNLNKKKSLSLEVGYLLRKHNLSGTYSVAASSDRKSNYDFNPYDFNEKYITIKGKFSLLVWENGEKMNFKLNGGIGMYFGSIKKTKTLNYSLTQNSNKIYSFNYNEDLNAKATGFLGFFGGEMSFRLNDKIDFSTSAGFDYFLKSNWKGTYTYNLPNNTTVDGDLYFIEYNKEKYLWVLNDKKYDELSNNKDYTLTKPVFSTGKINPRFSFGFIFKF